MGPSYGPLGLFRGILGTLKGTYRSYSRYIRIPGLRAHTSGLWFQPWIGLQMRCLKATWDSNYLPLNGKYNLIGRYHLGGPPPPCKRGILGR